MKDELTQSFDDSSLYGDSYPRHEDEVGMAVNERTPGDDDRGDETSTDPNDDQDYFSSDDDAYEIEEAEEESKIADEIQDEENEEYAEGITEEESKETILDKIKSNLIYILIGLILIVPASMKLYSVVFGPSQPAPAQTQGIGGFTSEKPVAPAVPNVPPRVVEPTQPSSSLEALLSHQQAAESAPDLAPEVVPEPMPSETPLVPETPVVPMNEVPPAEMTPPEITAPVVVPEVSPVEVPQETSNSMMPVGGGSEESSVIMPHEQPQNSDEVLNRYFNQETKVDQEVTQLISRLDEIDDRLAQMDDINQRLSALEEGTTGENSDTAEMSAQLQQLSNKVNQLDHGLNQLRQKVLAPEVVHTEPMGGHMRTASAGLIVEAVIPGRAWVRNQDGVLMVIEVGDEIPGVGKVTRIDAREGQVATTTQVFKQ